MARIVYLSVLVVALLVLAVGGWTVKGIRKLAAAAKPQPSPSRGARLLAPTA